MTRSIWIRTVTTPIGHLVATLGVHGVVVAAIHLAITSPHWGWLGFVPASVLYAFWYRAMLREAKSSGSSR